MVNECGFGNPRQCWILDSTPWIPDYRYWIADFIRLWDPGFLDLYSRFQRPGFHISQQKFAGFRIPRAKISRFRESGFPHMGQVMLVAPVRVCRGLVPKEATRREIIVIHLMTCLIFPL